MLAMTGKNGGGNLGRKSTKHEGQALQPECLPS